MLQKGYNEQLDLSGMQHAAQGWGISVTKYAFLNMSHKAPNNQKLVEIY